MTNAAYDEARSGGRHSGWLEQQRQLGENQLRGALRSFGDLIDEHRAWIANPSIKVHDFDTRPEQYKAGLMEKMASGHCQAQRTYFDFAWCFEGEGL